MYTLSYGSPGGTPGEHLSGGLGLHTNNLTILDTKVWARCWGDPHGNIHENGTWTCLDHTQCD